MLRVYCKVATRSVRLYASSSSPIDYDVIVIGGGSGGLAFSKAASSFGAKVALVDGVRPSPNGATWGIGGTCANVGCIPKKLMHHATIVGKEVEHASKYGWKSVEGKGEHDWSTLVKVVNDRIKANNWIYRVQLNEKKIKYYNAFASFVDSSTIKTVSADKKAAERILRAPSILIATGLRPNYPNIPGAELGITSDDVFTLSHSPGRTLVVGGGYVALETAGLLQDLGHPTDLLVRSRPLKGFDMDCVSRVMENLASHGVNVIQGNNVANVVEEIGKKKVTFIDSTRPSECYDTIVWAIGRSPRHSDLGIDTIGMVTSPNGRIVADEGDETTVKGVYAIGDVAEGRPELTPSAIRAGQLLAARLFGGEKKMMSYEKVATTVFTPLELGSVGMTEEQALEQYGGEQIEVYHSYFTPFEFVVPQDEDSKQCYAKVISLRNSPRTVLGLHFVGPNAAEVIQGYAVAMKGGMTVEQLQDTVAIHPCSSEELVKMSVTKRSGQDPHVTGCCG